MSNHNHLMHPRTAHNHADHGYFPTDCGTLKGIAARLDIDGGEVRIFDPCCGTGEALDYLAQHLTECGAVCTSYGIELDKTRALEARSVLDHTVQGNIESCILQPKRVGLLFLNPPYGFTAADNLSNRRTKRMEEVFFERTVPTLQEGGILVLILPVTALTERMAFEIASRFTGLQMFKAAVDTYRQVVIMGIRVKDRIGKTQCLNQQQMLLRHGEAVDISRAETDCCYYVPPSYLVGKDFKPISRSLEADVLDDEIKGIQAQTLWPHFAQVFGRAGMQEKRRPLCALGKWHSALALASGQVHGIVTGRNGRRLLIKGNTHKTKVTTEHTEEKSDGSIQHVTVHLDRFVPSIRAIDLTEGCADFGSVITIK